MDTSAHPPAPCYECGHLTTGRLGTVWFVDSPRSDDDGQVLLPSTPICRSGLADETDCMVTLYSDTTNPSSLADKILRYRRPMPTP